jgi:hypothetical protein
MVNRMKPTPTPNWTLKVTTLWFEHHFQPELARFLNRGWQLAVSHVARIVFLPVMPTSPWPPGEPADLDVATSVEEAARIVFATNRLIVAPALGVPRIEELTGKVPPRQTMFWVSPDRFDALDVELRRIYDTPRQPHTEPMRLDDLSDGELKRFLKDDFPRAASLDDFTRQMLLLPPI